MITIKWGPWSTRTNEYGFIPQVRDPVAAEAQGLKMVSTTGIAPVTSGFAWSRSDLTELRGQLALSHQMASVVGLAPTRPGLKTRPLELLCIHGPFECRSQNEECRTTKKRPFCMCGSPRSSFCVLTSAFIGEERSECADNRD
jgi:hypothetical protein